MLVDSHCHLADAAFAADRDVVLARSREAGITRIVAVADTLASAEAVIALAAAHPGVAATAGIHPHHAAEFDAAAAVRLEALLADPAVVAVGETGLDYHYDFAPRERQREVFAWHLAAAPRFAKPVVIHAREADADMARLIADAPAGLSGVLHCFSAGREVLEAGLARGLHVSWSGMITFRNWNAGWAVALVPDELLLVETDAPYLAPVPNRGKRNEPAFLPATAAKLAELRGSTPERIAALTTANAERLFRLTSDV